MNYDAILYRKCKKHQEVRNMCGLKSKGKGRNPFASKHKASKKGHNPYLDKKGLKY